MDFIFVMWMALHPRKSVIQYGVGSWLAAQLTLCAFPVSRTSGLSQISLFKKMGSHGSFLKSPVPFLQRSGIAAHSCGAAMVFHHLHYEPYSVVQ
jgi:hypothetical protein